MNIRLAEEKDITQLIRMRWDFTIEYDESKRNESYDDFEKECQLFLEKAFNSDQWFIWIAEENGEIASHIYIELIQKVPRPGRITYPFTYMTNVYTVPKYRNTGVGSKLLSSINNWVKENTILNLLLCGQVMKLLITIRKTVMFIVQSLWNISLLRLTRRTI